MEEFSDVGHDTALVWYLNVAEVLDFEEWLRVSLCASPSRKYSLVCQVPSRRPAGRARYSLFYPTCPVCHSRAALADGGESEHICSVSDWCVIVAEEDVQGETVCKAAFKILDVYFSVRLGLALTPKQEAILGGKSLFTMLSASTTFQRQRMTHVIPAIVKRRISVQIWMSAHVQVSEQEGSSPCRV